MTPSPRGKSARLDACIEAPERHDLAVREQAAFVSCAAASTASRPAFVTCARPSVGQDARISELIWVRWQAKFRNFRNWSRGLLVVFRCDQTGFCGLVRRANQFDPVQQFALPSSIRIKIRSARTPLPGQFPCRSPPERVFIKIKFRGPGGDVNYPATFGYLPRYCPGKTRKGGKP